METEAKEKDMQQRLQSSLDALRGESSILFGLVFVPKGFVVDLAVYSFL
jgi:hypothetical protein